MKSQKGFTLLEVMVAFALIVVILFTSYITQGSSLAGSTRNRNLLKATNLARNKIHELELTYDGAAFDKLEKLTEGAFEAPDAAFTWKVEVLEVDFSILKDLFLKKEKKEGEKTPETGQYDDILARTFQDYLNKSVRRMTVTVSWPVSDKSDSVSFTELLVNYDNEINVGI